MALITLLRNSFACFLSFYLHLLCVWGRGRRNWGRQAYPVKRCFPPPHLISSIIIKKTGCLILGHLSPRLPLPQFSPQRFLHGFEKGKKSLQHRCPSLREWQILLGWVTHLTDSSSEHPARRAVTQWEGGRNNCACGVPTIPPSQDLPKSCSTQFEFFFLLSEMTEICMCMCIHFFFTFTVEFAQERQLNSEACN